jgi:hypothetical protein
MKLPRLFLFSALSATVALAGALAGVLPMAAHAQMNRALNQAMNPAEKIAFRLASTSLSQKQSTRHEAYLQIMNVLNANSIQQAKDLKTAVLLIGKDAKLVNTLNGVLDRFKIPRSPSMFDPEAGDFEASDGGP